ncbi:MAG: TOBE domain-containing protein, partial [Rhodospirillaceae bacterium]|nr:TOBE domain-containing protein [Rhodospirillaceae bacterium]
SGTVTAAFFLGDRLRLRIALAGGETIQLDHPGHREMAAGTAVTVAVDPDAWFLVESAGMETPA